ncbi:hypothetical protein G6F57_006049 [Rhizopus arrhizus]|uniref:ABC transporter domain-containing protein n=1 Tax=Rhizopus oryzae TaxID=64495 RepID=A0A9P7BRX5_RHIOR|nr:hypothetical protein G6F23_004848 [Rhizopus arrhizus]KAG1415135.1 hypothetical protein G6F58_006618 [Rhizopus delemar]KAG0764728.1 hypothetical protein G6F24_004991 [Rhizopus arrhizus]KAG0790196.1 hypothetical protein G6F21_005988 [Rhizopus arrhizus]KAG0808673.1 hypothetical protein G6F20_009389 [Rhizopus arrhizus]
MTDYTHSVEVNDLTFGYGGPSIINHLSLKLDDGNRCILVGANGAGKTTLLRILAGKRMIPGEVKVLGRNAFLDAPPGITYLGTEWANNAIVKSDLSVEYLLKSMGSHRWPERTQELLQVLDVDTAWHMHQISDGQRRRVQLVMGLLHPWRLLLLDEVTVDLDVLARSDFLSFLKKETEERGCTIVYATHIFDGLGDWATHIAHVTDGTCLSLHSVADFPELEKIKQEHRKRESSDSPLTTVCLGWLREDRDRLRNKKPIDPTTGLPHTKWDDMSENMKANGDNSQLKPSVSTMARAYAFGWAITTVPGLLSISIKALAARNKQSAIQKAILVSIPLILKRSLTSNGFPLLLAMSLGGQRILRLLYERYTTHQKKLSHKAAIFASSLFSIWTVRLIYPTIKTLDLTFFVLVRALDVFSHRIYASAKVRQRVPEWILEYSNVMVFMMASTEIIFSWFYEPQRLPKSYAQWITNMSGTDERILKTLRAMRSGEWVYGKDSAIGNVLSGYCEQLGLPRSYGDPRSGRMDCAVIHEGSLWGCEVNAMYRFMKGFIKIFPVYLIVHLAPPLFFKTSRLMENPIGSFSHILAASVRSSTFLGTYIAIIWYCICLVRTRVGHQILGVNQTRLDDTLGPLLASMLCGLSLLVESKHRRGEMALYVLPRALFSVTGRVLSPLKRQKWWGAFGSRLTEDIAFAASVMVVIEAIFKDKDMVRPSIRGLMSWILKKELKSDASVDKLASDSSDTPEDDREETVLEIRST